MILSRVVDNFMVGIVINNLTVDKFKLLTMVGVDKFVVGEVINMTLCHC